MLYIKKKKSVKKKAKSNKPPSPQRTKKRKSKTIKEPSTTVIKNGKSKEINIDDIVQIIVPEVIKSMERGVVVQCPREILTEIFQLANKIFVGSKEPLLMQHIPDYPTETKDRVWKAVTEVINDLLSPLLEAVYTQVNFSRNTSHLTILPKFGGGGLISDSNIQNDGLGQSMLALPEVIALNKAIKAYNEAQSSSSTSTDDSRVVQLSRSVNVYWPKPFKINFIRQNKPNDVTTIHCRILSLPITNAIVDTGSDSSIISENIAKSLGLEIDKNILLEIKGVASLAKAIGITHNVPITIGYGDSELTITDDFLVVEAGKDKKGIDKSLIILGVPWLYHAGSNISLMKGEFTVNLDGKVMSIPLSVHKFRREVKQSDEDFSDDDLSDDDLSDDVSDTEQDTQKKKIVAV